MKTKRMILIMAVVCLAIASCKYRIGKAVRSHAKADPTEATAATMYRLDEIIVMYKGQPTDEEINIRKGYLAARGITDRINVRKCQGCKAYVEVWEADNIHTMIHAEGISPGTVTKSGPVGDDEVAYYSVNYLNRIPMDTTVSFKDLENHGNVEFSSGDKKTITVAVLDTGIDVDAMVNPSFQWKNAKETDNEKDDDGNCYDDDMHGWNFVGNNSDVNDDNPNLHGTLVSQYIINEFESSPNNFVQIMSLKTHDSLGGGDLFSTICALHYAMDKKVNIINASWGFYHYKEGRPHPYLDKLITETLREKGILFVAAAGNADKESDDLALEAYSDRFGEVVPGSILRNLEYHSFYPACLSRQGKNVVTVTTTDGMAVSPTQNYSEQFVDIGVLADVNDAGAMRFKSPFPGTTTLISGSSYATAIASGKIGAYFPQDMYGSGLNKDAVFEELTTATLPPGKPPLITYESELERHLIRNGKKTYPK